MIFHCTNPDCDHEWKQNQDKNGLYDGYGCPPCPECGCHGANHNDYGEFKCKVCGHIFKRYGNGGLHLGRIPSCPKCNSPMVIKI